MRYEAHHKERTRRQIVESASRQFRSEGLNGPGVAQLMKASGLTVGGFYKHFRSKQELLTEAVDASVVDVAARVAGWVKGARPGEAWKEIVKHYLSIEHCEHPELGCPVAALAPDIARTRPATRKKLQTSLEAYKQRFLPFMPGANASERQTNFTLIFTAMIGAMAVARTLPDRQAKEEVLQLVRNHLLSSF